MERFGSVNQALDFAISEERAAQEFYTRLAAEAHGSLMRKVFEEFAAQEAAHRARLEKVKTGKELISVARQVTELSMTDYMVARDTSPDMSYQDALLVAMQKEKAAYRMYVDLAAAGGAGALRELFLALAQEEASHRVRIELEYDTFVTPEH